MHRLGRKIHREAAAVHWILLSVQRLIQQNAAFGLLHPTGPVH